MPTPKSGGIASTILRTLGRNRTNSLSQALIEVITSDRTNQPSLLDISRQVKVVAHARNIVQTRRRRVVRGLAVEQLSVPVWRNRERCKGHVGRDGLARLVGDARGLRIGDDPVEEVAEDGRGWAGSVGVDEDEGVLCRRWVEAWLSREGEVGLHEGLCWKCQLLERDGTHGRHGPVGENLLPRFTCLPL